MSGAAPTDHHVSDSLCRCANMMKHCRVAVNLMTRSRVMDSHLFNADPDTDPDPAFILIADPDPVFTPGFFMTKNCK